MTDPLAKPGVYDGSQLPRVTGAQHHSSSRLSRSQLAHLVPPGTPRGFRHAMDRPELPTAAMALGSYTHTLILEPDLAEAEYALVSESQEDRRSKDQKAAWAEFVAEANAAGRTIVGWCPRTDRLFKGHAQEAQAIAQEVLDDPMMREVLQGAGFAEVSLAWDTDEGDQLRARLDRYYQTEDGGWMIVDLKSTSIDAGATRWHWQRVVDRDSLHIQAAFYVDGFCATMGVDPERVQFAHAVYETGGAHLGALHLMASRAIEVGRMEYRQALATYRRCRESGEWPGYAFNPEPLDLPAWRYTA